MLSVSTMPLSISNVNRPLLRKTAKYFAGEFSVFNRRKGLVLKEYLELVVSPAVNELRQWTRLTRQCTLLYTAVHCRILLYSTPPLLPLSLFAPRRSLFAPVGPYLPLCGPYLHLSPLSLWAWNGDGRRGGGPGPGPASGLVLGRGVYPG